MTSVELKAAQAELKAAQAEIERLKHALAWALVELYRLKVEQTHWERIYRHYTELIDGLSQ